MNIEETTQHIAVVDDDKQIRQLLSEFLTKNGFAVSAMGNGNELLQSLEENKSYALIILDIMLPGIDGIELCKRVFAKWKFPILMLTAVNELTDRIISLEFGADDYLTKPFNPRELLARVKAILRRTSNKPIENDEQEMNAYSKKLEFCGWVLDTATRTLLTPDQVEVPLTGKGYDLLMVFLEHPQRTLSRDQLLDILNNRSAEPFDRSIDVQVSRLRQKLGDNSKEPKLIKTIRTGGYLFTAAVKKVT